MSEAYATLSDYLYRTKTRVEDFAARIGVGGPYVSMLARGLRTPSLPVALRIAEATGIPVASLLPPQPVRSYHVRSPRYRRRRPPQEAA